jgi:hypothetical protein
VDDQEDEENDSDSENLSDDEDEEPDVVEEDMLEDERNILSKNLVILSSFFEVFIILRLCFQQCSKQKYMTV